MIIFVYICVVWSTIVGKLYPDRATAMFYTLIMFAFFMSIHFVTINSIFSINTPVRALVAVIFNPYTAYYYSFLQVEISMHYGKIPY